MRFHKYHALGNDYLVLEPKDCPQVPSAAAIRAICHRNFGLGSDGILYGPLSTEGANFGLRIFNPDGSEAEKSGNGLRIFCRYLFDGARVKSAPFTVETLGGVVTCEVREHGAEIEVEMGQATFDSTRIPIPGEAREVLDEPIEVAEKSLKYYGVSVGNPHCVIPMEDVSEALAHELGPVLERHPNFPNRTNVQLLKVLDRRTIQIEIWERGAGYTLASGTSSSAAAAVAHKMGACDASIIVKMPGGAIGIEIGDDYAIRMTGPATRVGVFFMDPGVPTQPIPG
ncbi:MAG: diaminopimelate epimerase [Opitutales bacterium]